MPDHHSGPIGQLTAAALDRYASQLARCLKALETSALIRARVQHELATVRAEQDARASSGPGHPPRRYDASGLTASELDRTRRELAASLALARPGSPACVPILAHPASLTGPQEVHGLANAQKLAILVAMSVTEQMSLADVKNRLSEVVDRLQKEHGRVVITKHGHPAAVVISLDDLESLEETLDVMDSAALLDDIREALADSDAQVLTKEDALRLIADR